MGRYWLVRSGTKTVELQPDHKALTIVSRQTPRMSIGDTVLFLEGWEEKRFTATAGIARIVEIEGAGAEEMKLTKVELVDEVVLPEALDLDSMWYSLTIVRNTTRPHLHFRRGYRLLPQEDFYTIKKGEPFVARSGYFELLNALPQSLRVSFESEQILRAGEMRKRAGFRERLERLYAFIDQRVLAVGRLLHELAQEITKVDLGDAPIDHRFVSEPDPIQGFAARPDELESQLRRFAGLWEILAKRLDDQALPGKRDLIGDTLRQLDVPERRQTEARFERLFAAAP